MVRRARVAFVVPALFGNGAERAILRIASGLIERGHSIDILLLRSFIARPDEIPDGARLVFAGRHHSESPGKSELAVVTEPFNRAIRISAKLSLRNCLDILRELEFRPETLPSVSMFTEARFVADYVDREHPSCIIPILPKGKVATLLAKTLLRRFPPVISSVRNDLRSLRRRELARYRLLLPRSDHIIAVSNGVRSSVIQTLGFPAKKITTIYNPIFVSNLDALARCAPAHPWLADEGPSVILATGRLAKSKDFPTLVKAFRRVSKVREVRLIVLGEGRQRKSLVTLVRNLGLRDRVSLPGYVENPYAYMSRAKLFVLSSKVEGLPNVLIEALACGCPCVSTDCPSGPAEILADGRIGSLVPVGDEIALADAIIRTLDEPPDRTVLRSRAAMFSFDKSVDMYEQIIIQATHREASQPNLLNA